MNLIKIYSDRVQIKTDAARLKSLKINDLLLLSDKSTSIVCVVTGLVGNDPLEVYDFDQELLGMTESNNTIDCGIIGSINSSGKFTKSIDIYPTTNATVDVVSEEMFASMLHDQLAQCIKLGKYASYDADAWIDGNKLFQRHFAIVGNTGSGKSYAVTSFLEKAADRKGANIILFDLHGEYSGLDFVKTVKIGNGGLDFPMWFLPFKDLYNSILRLKDESATLQLAALRKAYCSARSSDTGEDAPIAYNIESVLESLQAENEEQVSTGEVYKIGDKAGLPKTVKGDNNGKLTSLCMLLQDKLTDTRFAFMSRNNPQQYLYKFTDTIFGIDEKSIKVIDLSDVPSDVRPTLIAVITKLVYSIQLQQEREEATPLTIVCEEAHTYIPSSDFSLGASQRRLLEIFEIIAKEGRKFGTTLCVVTQRPSELNRTIMAQCANFIVLKMTNESDKSMMASVIPESNRNVIDALSLFMPGDCLVLGDSAEIAVKINIDLPSQPPNSATISTWDIWKNKGNVDVSALVSKLIADGR